jgi:hypothetical protein
MGKNGILFCFHIVADFGSQIANDIRSAIEKYKEQYRQTEKDAANDIPLLFREFATAPEEGREEILVRRVTTLIELHMPMWNAVCPQTPQSEHHRLCES